MAGIIGFLLLIAFGYWICVYWFITVPLIVGTVAIEESETNRGLDLYAAAFSDPRFSVLIPGNHRQKVSRRSCNCA
jgi:hypothetical protein